MFSSCSDDDDESTLCVDVKISNKEERVGKKYEGFEIFEDYISNSDK